MKRTETACERPSAPMYDDGGAIDPITCFQPGAQVRIKGDRLGVVYTALAPARTVMHYGTGDVLMQTLAYTVFNTVTGVITQRTIDVFVCTLEPHVAPVPAVPSGFVEKALDELKPIPTARLAEVLDGAAPRPFLKPFDPAVGGSRKRATKAGRGK